MNAAMIARRMKFVSIRNKKLRLFERLEDRRLLAGFENFDGVTAPALPVGWVQTSSAGTPWATVAGANSDSAPNHAFVPNFDNTSENILTSPTFVLPATTPLLQFRNSYNTESTWDGGVLEISVNGSAFTDILTAGGSFLSGGYNGALVTAANGNTNVLAGRQAWNGNSSGYITTLVSLPASAINQNVALRWRMGSDSSVAVIGWQIDTITLESIPTDDYGDAPAPYPVTLAENGARHTVGALFLGATVDADSNGVHSGNASGDGSDEDGVLIQGGFVRGSIKNIQVTASQAGGLLNAWIDWNSDGDWADTGEQVFTNAPLNAGSNSLNVSVPASAAPATTFARFRLSTVSGLSFNGPAANGEVEDYGISISTAGAWSPLGPFSATNGQVENIANRPVSGAVSTVLAHPTNPDILYIGAVNGGVWKTTNATAAQPNWTPLTDSMPSQSIGAMAFDLSDASSNTLYVGNGRYGSFGQVGNDRSGLMRSTDGGQTWQLVGGGIFAGKNISGIVANGNTIVVSVNVADSFTFGNIGIFRSTNGGTTFTQISTGNGATTGLPGGTTYDLVADPTNPSILYTSTIFSDLVGGVRGVYKSINAGANWTKVSNPAMDALITNNTSNLEMAVGRSNEVYAAILNAGALAGLFRSPDGGVSWILMDTPKTNENGTDVGLNPSGGKGPTSGKPEQIAGGQGSIHFSILADPTNANIVYVGGDRQPRTNGDTGGFPNSIGALDFSGRLFRGDASKPAGSQFVPLTHRNDVAAFPGGGTASSSSPHADSRDMTIDANGNIIEVDDGGVYRRTSPLTNTGDWFSVIGNLQVTEAHDVGWDSLSNVAMSGNQDTGSTYQPSENSAQWVSISTGDGGDIAIDNIVNAGVNQSVRYSSFQNLGALRRSVWNASGQLLSQSFPSLTPINGSAAITGAFRTPVETNSVAGNRLIIQGGNGIYESLNGGTSINSIGAGLGVTNILTNSIAYGGTRNNVVNPDVVWAANAGNVYLRTTGTGNVTRTTGTPAASTIRDLAVNSRDWANAFVIDDNQIFQTTDAGATWTDITGNLLVSANAIFSVSFVAGINNSSVVVGTNRGAYFMSTQRVASWTPLGGGLPNVLAFDMQYSPADDILVVGTLGRGVWALRDVSALIQQPAVVVGQQVFYNDSGFETAGGVDNAIDTSKVVLRSSASSQNTSYTNVSNYTRGINGLMVSVNNLANNTLNASDFIFRASPPSAAGVVNPSTWPLAPNPSVIAITPAVGATPARIRLEWPDNAIQNTWLQVIVRANSNTGLTTPVVLYFGSAIGDVNGAVGVGAAYRTGIPDLSAVQLALQNGQTGVTTIDNPLDVDKSTRVGVPDLSFVQSHVSATVLLRNITIPAAGSAEEGASAGSPTSASLLFGSSDPMTSSPTTKDSKTDSGFALAAALPNPLTLNSEPIGRKSTSGTPIQIQFSQLPPNSWLEKSKQRAIDGFFEQLGSEQFELNSLQSNKV